MKKLLKIILIIVLSLIGLLFIVLLGFYSYEAIKAEEAYSLLGESAPMLEVEGHRFRDLNKNGQLDAYEDVRLDVDTRVNDLVNQMTLDEKAGTMFVQMIGMTPKGNPIDKPFFSTNPLDILFMVALPHGSEMLAKMKMNSFNTINSYEPRIMARFNNTIQKYAERTRLGIPVTIASDPRHGTEQNPGAALYTPGFSQWPNSLGLAATRDTLLVREFGNIARQEYLSVGIRLALHPMADLATEPRWGRTNGTFGEDAALSGMMTKAYILGFQGDSLYSRSVATMTKHFSGGGPQAYGEDAHFPYGKEQVYPGDNFAYHVRPFVEGAFPAKTAQIMPYYGIPKGQTNEDVAFGFNKEILTDLLRDSLKFEGVICTDWNIINNTIIGEARAWGVEELSITERVAKSIRAGADQFGGESCPEVIVQLVKTGEISESRIDISVKRILRDKFRLGLFDNPYVDEDMAGEISGSEAFRLKGKVAQAKSTILLKNDAVLPLAKSTKIYVEGMSTPETINTYGEWVEKPEEADIILLMIRTPFDIRKEYFLENFFHQGSLYYTQEEIDHVKNLAAIKPTIVVANIERPAILTDHAKVASVLMTEFGVSDDVLVDLLFGHAIPDGTLPFELPSSWDAVLNQMEDVPYDSEKPLYPFGYGLKNFGLE